MNVTNLTTGLITEYFHKTKKMETVEEHVEQFPAIEEEEECFQDRVEEYRGAGGEDVTLPQ